MLFFSGKGDILKSIFFFTSNGNVQVHKEDDYEANNKEINAGMFYDVGIYPDQSFTSKSRRRN